MDQPITWILLTALVTALAGAIRVGFWMRDYMSKRDHDIRNQLIQEKADLIIEIGELEKRLQIQEAASAQRLGMRDELSDTKIRLRDVEARLRELELQLARGNRGRGGFDNRGHSS